MPDVLRGTGIVRSVVALFVACAALSLVAVAAAQDPSATPAATLYTSSMPAEDAIVAATEADGMLRFDISENALMFVFDPDLVHEDGLPAYGATFITRAYIYPAGTLTADNGVNADGSPEFPDQVLGIWICRGWFVGDGMRTTTGAMLATSQIYDFGNVLGAATLTSDGHELADVGVAISRAVTGGTGPFMGARGEARQTLIGLNATEGVNLQIELEYEAIGS